MNSVEPYIEATRQMILNSFIVLLALVGIMVLIGVFAATVMTLLKR